jgi:hypothetical protein
MSTGCFETESRKLYEWIRVGLVRLCVSPNLTLPKVTWQRYVDPKSNLIVLAKKKRNEGFHWLQQRFMANTSWSPFYPPVTNDQTAIIAAKQDLYLKTKMHVEQNFIELNYNAPPEGIPTLT